MDLPKGVGWGLPLWLLTLTQASKPKRQRLQDLLEPEDRALLEALLDGLSQAEREELHKEAAALLAEEDQAVQNDPKELEATVTDLVLQRGFGPERLAKYHGKVEVGGSR